MSDDAKDPTPDARPAEERASGGGAAPQPPAPQTSAPQTPASQGPARRAPAREMWRALILARLSAAARLTKANLIVVACALGLFGVGVTAILLRRPPTDTPAPPSVASAATAPALPAVIAPCLKTPTGDAPGSAGSAQAAPGPRVISGKLDNAPLAQALRSHMLGPDEVYRVRRAFESLAGWGAPQVGRFVASLRASSGVVEAFQLVVSPTEIYRATLDPHGNLVAERSRDLPEVRPCYGSIFVADDLASGIEASPFHSDLRPALQGVLGAGADLRAGTSVRLIAREVVALGTFAGYDGIVALEVRPGGEIAPSRVYRFQGTTSKGYFDARGEASGQAGPPLAPADALAFQAEKAALDARLDAITVPTSAEAGSDRKEDPEGEDDDAPVEGTAPKPSVARTVEQAAAATCSTRIVSGLSKQIIAEARCLNPDAFVQIPPRKNLVASSNVVLYLEAPARDRLLRALDKYPKRKMTVNSALRTVAQQVLLSKWGEKKRCGVKLAALPGESNHESGLALDVREASLWRSALEAEGFRWMGKEDPVHFDYQGPGAIDHRGLDVRAFQRLWTRNHPDDPLPDTGKVDAATATRLARSPAAGFERGARCDR